MQTFTTEDGRTFEYVRREPYQRKDKTWMELDVWWLQCSAPGCDEYREFKVPAGSTTSQYFKFKHCAKHAVSSEEFRKRGALALVAKINNDPTRRRRVLTDAEIVEIRKLAAEGFKYADIALLFPATPGTVREIVKGRRRAATAPK